MIRSSSVLLVAADGRLIMRRNEVIEAGMKIDAVEPFRWDLMSGERPQDAVVRGMLEEAHSVVALHRLSFIGTRYRRKANLEEHIFVLENVAMDDLKLAKPISSICISGTDDLGAKNISSFGREIASNYFSRKLRR